MPAPLAAPRDPSVLYRCISVPVMHDRASLNMMLWNMFAAPARMTEGTIPVSFIISRPYLIEKTIPSWAALKRWAFVCVLKFNPRILAPTSLLPSILSAPLPKGSIESPSEPGFILSARSFISLYDRLFPVLRLSHELRIPVPLMHSSTPDRGDSLEWLTCRNVFTLDCD